MKLFLQRYVILSLCILLVACGGWKLRGQVQLSESLRLLAINPDKPFDDLQQELRDSLAMNNIEVVPAESKPTAILRLENESFIVSAQVFDRENQPTENKLMYTITMSVTDGQGKIISPKQTLNAVRFLRYNPNYLLSSASEEKLMQRDMRKDLVGQMMRRLEKIP